MKKRSAMVMAAGLVAALLAGAAAISVGLTAPDAAQAGSKPPEPIVRTITETVTVHRKAKAEQTPTVRVIAAPAAQTAPAASYEAMGEEGAYEDGAQGSGEHEGEQYEDGQHDDGGWAGHEDEHEDD